MILQIILWIWVISFVNNIIWYYRNPDMLGDYYKEFDLFPLDERTFKIIVYIFSFIAGPAITYIHIKYAVREFFQIRKIHRKYRKIKKAIKRKENL